MKACVEVIGAYHTGLTNVSRTSLSILDVVMVAEVVLRVWVNQQLLDGVCSLGPSDETRFDGMIDDGYDIVGRICNQETNYTQPLMLFGSASLWVLQYSIFDPFSKFVVFVETR